MARRGLGAKGYYAESRGETREQKKISGSEVQRNRAILLFLILAILAAYLILRSTPGAIPPVLGGATPTPFGFQTPTPGGAISPTPFGQTPIPGTLTPTGEVTLAPGQTPTPTPTLTAGQKRFLINTTLGPTNYSVGSTVLSVLKNLFVTENSYKETVDVQNVGQNAASFYLFDIIPASFGVSVWDVNFASSDFEALSERIARFSYSLEPGESLQHGPTRMPVGNTTATVTNLLLPAGKGFENGDGTKWLDFDALQQSLAQLPPEAQADFQDYVSERISFDDPETNDQPDLIAEDIENYLETLLINQQIRGQLGLELNYSNLTRIVLTISEADAFRWFSIPLNEQRYGFPLFKFEGDLPDVAKMGYAYNQTLLNVTLDFTGIRRVCGKIPFDELRGVLNYSFASYLPKMFNTTIIVEVLHADVGTVSLPQTTCEDAKKVLAAGLKYLGTPYQLYPSPTKTFNCARFVTQAYNEALPGSLPHSISAYATYTYLKQRNVLEISDPTKLLPADIIIFNGGSTGAVACGGKTCSHVGMYYGNDQMLHSGNPVKLAGFSNYIAHRYGGNNFFAAFRFINCDEGGESASPSTSPNPSPTSEAEQAAQKTDILADIEKECGLSTGELGKDFLEYWKDEVAGKERPLPSACFNSEMNSILDSKMKSNGLYDRGFDKELVLSIMATESSCNHNQGNGQGIMQVVACGNKGGCSLEENIDLGTKHLASDFDGVKSKGVTGGAIPTLITFAYNRGSGTQAKAISLYLGGTDLKEAMAQACYYYYDKGAYGGCGGFGKTQCCTGNGLGTGYPERVAQFYAWAVKNKQA